MDLKVNYKKDLEIPKWLLNKVDDDHLLARVILNRGIDTIKKLDEFLNPEEHLGIKPSYFPRLEEGVEIILDAIAKDRSILVYGDYDVDGVSSTAILIKTLRTLGANVSYHLPDRFTEGYGMNRGVIKKLAKKGIDLIITCDCGISNYEEVELANDLGLDVIITDHHGLPDKLPPARLILSPKLLEEDDSAYHLPGAGMAYFLAKGLLNKESKEDKSEVLLEFLALAIVADVVPLYGENRYLLQKGLKALKSAKSVGIQELCKVSGIDPFNLSEIDIGFRLGPRINAAGRLFNASLALKLLLSEDRSEAKKLAQRLDSINSKRKELTQQMEDEARSLLSKEDELTSIILYKKEWNQGIIGIGAGRLCENFKLPTVFLANKRGEEGVIVGSARSIPQIHIREALKECDDLLLGFGGHAGAAGLSLKRDNLEEFKARLNGVLAREMKKVGKVRKIEVDAKLPLSKLNLDLYHKLELLAPFGEGNPRPSFYSQGLELINYRKVGDGKHLKLTLGKGEKKISALWWSGDEETLKDKMDLTYSLDINEWRGRVNLQMIIEEVIGTSIEGVRKEKEIEINFEDYRNWRELGEELPPLNNPLYYYEGTKDISFTPIINRYQDDKAKDLVLLSTPPTLGVFKDILKNIQPQRVLLAYSKIQLKSDKDFLRELMQIIKGIIEQEKGITKIEELASLTGEEEGNIILALRYLQEEGLIELEFIERRSIFIKKGREGKSKEVRYKSKLRKALEESRAFKRYLLKKDLDEIQALVKIH
ncbi:single-stranded-DNA-specific exonuclease RecJ [Halonatronum saccharophilum]|uniref:single-stranded-DNA-specific exonuclease RecJ n=1 Tax=Halonatronum saccharophilum TaxID=150060 RepID=UPI00048250F0|nr:single-stranded-DNA-specific exonuclease RecJ [Halonatronum saccharophilum]